MRNTWLFAQPASLWVQVIDGSAGQSRSRHPPALGNARKPARSVRGLPSTCHYREEDHEEQLRCGPLEIQWEQQEVSDEEGLICCCASILISSNTFLLVPRRRESQWPTLTVRAVSGKQCCHLLSPALWQQHSRSTWGYLNKKWSDMGVWRQALAKRLYIMLFWNCPVIYSEEKSQRQRGYNYHLRVNISCR